MARLGADVVGADAAERNIPVARIHAEQSDLTIDYRHTTAEAVAGAGEQFDAVLNMEVVRTRCRPAGLPDRLPRSAETRRPDDLLDHQPQRQEFRGGDPGAEWVMRWLPKGTHDWSKFITPDELYDLLSRAGLEPVDKRGFVFNPVSWSWRMSDRDLSVNYVTASLRSH